MATILRSRPVVVKAADELPFQLPEKVTELVGPRYKHDPVRLAYRLS